MTSKERKTVLVRRNEALSPARSPSAAWAMVLWMLAMPFTGQAGAQSPDITPDVPGVSAAALAVPVALPFEKTLPGPINDYVLLTAEGERKKEYLLKVAKALRPSFRLPHKLNIHEKQKPLLAAGHLANRHCQLMSTGTLPLPMRWLGKSCGNWKIWACGRTRW